MDNLKTLQSTIEQHIDPNGTPGSILAINHQNILKEVLNKVGKWTGSAFVANKNATTFPSGTMSWDGNAMNNTNDFTITTSKKTADLNDVGLILETMVTGDIIQFKDFVGRSVFLTYKSHVAGTDGGGLAIYTITVAGSVDNPNYIYQDTETQIAVMSYHKKLVDATPAISTDPGNMATIGTDGKIYVAKPAETPSVENRYNDTTAMIAGQGNQTDGFIQYVGDASGDPTVDAGFAYYEYLGTTAGTLADYRKLSESESMDMIIESAPPTENTFADITELTGGQGSQSQNFYQFVTDATADPTVNSGWAIYQYKGTTVGDLTDYIKIMEAESMDQPPGGVSSDANNALTIGTDGKPFLDSSSLGGGGGGSHVEDHRVWTTGDPNTFTVVDSAKITDLYLNGKRMEKFEPDETTPDEWRVNSPTQIEVLIELNNQDRITIVESSTTAGGVGGSDVVTFQTPEITASNYTLVTTDAGMDKMLTFNSENDQQILLNENVFTTGKVINLWRKGQGSVEIKKGQNVKIRGIRDLDNKYFVNDIHSPASLICESSNLFRVYGNLKRGGSAVSIGNYDPEFINTNTTIEVTVNGSGFSEDMDVSLSGATLNSWTFINRNQITLNITTGATDPQYIDVTFDNGEITTNNNGMLVTDTIYFDEKFDLTTGYGLFKMTRQSDWAVELRRSNDNALTRVGFDTNGKVSLNSPVEAGGDLATWIGLNDGFVSKRIGQGSKPYDQVQTDPNLQPKLVSAGVVITHNGVPMIEWNSDFMETIQEENFAQNDYTLLSFARSKSNHNGMFFNTRKNGTTEGFQFKYKDSGNFQFFTRNTPMTSGTELNSASTNLNQNYQVSAIKTINASKLRVDGVETTAVFANAEPTGITGFYAGQSKDGLNIFDGFTNHDIYINSDRTVDIQEMETYILSKI